jgi:hypothetical protein
MKRMLNRALLQSVLVKTLIIMIGATGLLVIGFEVRSFLNGSSASNRQFSLNQQKQLELLQSELDEEVRHLVQIFPAFVKSQELYTKITETTLVGPHFVYSPQLYGLEIDYWDQVQFLKRQIWLANYFLPLLQSNQLDYLGVFLIDPHNNLLRHSIVPFIELKPNQVYFYSFSVKGLFHQLGKHSLKQIEKIALTDDYFDQVIYNRSESNSLYSALDFDGTILSVADLPAGHATILDKIKVITEKERFILEKSITLDSRVYNWKTKTRETTAVVTLVAQKVLDVAFLKAIREKFGSDYLVLVNDTNPVVSTLPGLAGPLAKNQGTIAAASKSYHYRTQNYPNPWLDSKIGLAVLTEGNQVTPSPVNTYKSIAVTAVITLFLGLMTWFYLKSNPVKTPGKLVLPESAPEGQIVADAPAPDINSTDPRKDRFLLIEDKGKSQTIPLLDVSHIRVTDHYCTIFYLQENRWQSWMIMERLKTFENRYQSYLVKINRSTLINPNRIDKIQLLQRKLTMQGEPDYLLTISPSSLDIIKSVMGTGIQDSTEV